MDPSRINQDHLAEAIARWNNGDLDGYLQLYSPKVRLSGYAGVEPGIDSVRTFYRALWDAFPRSRITIEDLIGSGDRIACRFVMSGRHDGAFQGLPATGREFTLPGITILRFEDGRCVERWSQADFLGLMVQLGALPQPGAPG